MGRADREVVINSGFAKKRNRCAWPWQIQDRFNQLPLPGRRDPEYPGVRIEGDARGGQSWARLGRGRCAGKKKSRLHRGRVLEEIILFPCLGQVILFQVALHHIRFLNAQVVGTSVGL